MGCATGTVGRVFLIRVYATVGIVLLKPAGVATGCRGAETGLSPIASRP